MSGVIMRNLRSLSLMVISWGLLAMTTRSKKIDASNSTSFQPSPWEIAHATFYGDESARATMGGACGYGDLFSNGYGTETAALSTVLFNGGKTCGACYQLKCVNSRFCLPGSPGITITATNLCPPNFFKSSNAGGWCNPPRSHFDLSLPVYMKFARKNGGIVPVSYRRVPCMRSGGIRFAFEGNKNWLLVTILNVGGGGDVAAMWVKGSRKKRWISMTQNWGASFQAFAMLRAQALSFKLQSGSGQILIINNVAPPNWTSGRTYQSKVNFT